MTSVVEKSESSSVAEVARQARAASRRVARLPLQVRNDALLRAADGVERGAAEILAANAIDCAAAEKNRLSPALLHRLRTSERGVREMAVRLREVAALDDPINRTLAVTELDDELVLTKVSCPLGVIGIVFESRPDVVPQVASLAFKSGNACLLKGGSEAAETNRVLFSILRDSFAQFPEIPAAAINLLHSRADVDAMLALHDDVALIVPRGSKEFVNSIAERSRIPVLGHGEGICHVYVDRAADLSRAADIVFDAKAQYPAVCNAAETLLVHADVAAEFLPAAVGQLRQANVEVRGCEKTRAIVPDVVLALESDWAAEYGDLIISVKVVEDLDAALDHIHAYGSLHTEAIVTQDEGAARRFLDEVDAAGVYHNVSTRFADGFRYGFGAEVGISTAKLHARGPVGLDGLTIYKYQLVGAGHTVGPYARGERRFRHKKVDVRE